MSLEPRGRKAFTLVEIMIVVAIIGLLAAIAIPSFVKSTRAAQRNTCINNLRQIDGAKQAWAMETRQGGQAVPSKTDIDPYLGRAGRADNIVCPAGGAGATFEMSYEINSVTNLPTCKVEPATHVLM